MRDYQINHYEHAEEQRPLATKITNLPVIVSGMHRSGTSLVASLLASLSVNMGDELVPGDSHNQPGYFEDVKFNRFHKRVLAQSSDPVEPGHSDWGWTESERLDLSQLSGFHDEALGLLNASNHHAGPWGWKDPRTTLFLDFWDSLLEEARYVLVYRFPWDVADSMQRLGAEVFLRNPEYAYRIWTFYNRRLRDFYVKHRDRCLLVSVNALQKDLQRFVFLLNDKLGLPPQESRLEEVLKKHLFRTIEGQDPLIDLVSAAYPDCARILSELDELADISGAGLWQARPVRSRLARPDDEGEHIDVSVVMPCYEQGTLLLEAIASVERHAPPRCELIIVNDGSKQPRTLAILDLLKRHGYFVIDQENAGLSVSRNKAIDLARGRYILPLDDDNRIREGFIAEAIEVLDSSPEVGIVYGDRYDFGLRTKIEKVPDFDLDALLECNYIDACAVFRKQVWADCQGYDLFMSNVTDWELWIHAAKKGWGFHHIPRVTFDYRVRPGSMVTNVTEVKYGKLVKWVQGKHSELYLPKAAKELEQVKRQLADQTEQNNRLRDEREELLSKLEVAEAHVEITEELAAKGRLITEKDQELAAKNHEIMARDEVIAEKEREIATRDQEMLHRDQEIAEKEREISAKDLEIMARDQEIAEKEREIARKDQAILTSNQDIVAKDRELLRKDQEIFAMDARIERMTGSLGWRLLSRYGRIKYRYLLPIYRLFDRAPNESELKPTDPTDSRVAQYHQHQMKPAATPRSHRPPTKS